jgi:Asp-tRNA(Asn)/Glu-tRNA(Gln) amidotransferase A subunit family amidase
VSKDLYRILDQIEARFLASEPELRCFIPEPGRFARLREEAAEILALYPEPEKRPALFGVFVGVKDIFRVEGFATQAGSRLPPELFQGREAKSVSKLKKAGALILGKTVTTEFAYFEPGSTRNPHNSEHTPGGSSSGSAAAVSAGLCSLALGTQTIGSIIRPAAFCGVVGLKPSYDRISREGVIPLSPSLDHVGCFAPDVTGVKLAASQLYDDWRTDTSAANRPTLGIPEGPYLNKTTKEGAAHFENTWRLLEKAGFNLRHVEALHNFSEIYARHNLVLAAEAARVHSEWFEQHAHLYAPKTAELIRCGQMISSSELASALEGRAQLRAELTRLMDEHEIDLWVSPPAPGPAPRGLGSTGDPVMNLPWTHAGLPTLHLPARKNQAGLPTGIQLTGRWYADEALLAWGEALERTLGWTQPWQ